MIVFVHPGQGAQHVGMGVQMAAQFKAARRAFEEASDAVGLDLLALCREGPEERLRATENTQPALLAASCAVAAVLMEHGVLPGAAAGLSLGEYSALVSAGALGLADAALIVRRRGLLMREAAEGLRTAMAAVMGLEAEVVDGICRETPGLVEAANFNAPGQVVIAGTCDAVAEATARLRGAGARKVVPLAVSAPFHTSLMRQAAERLAPVIGAACLVPPRIPVVTNVAAQPVREPEQIRLLLLRQVAAPVRWEQSVRALGEMGATTFVEAGPGRTLAGLIARTLPAAEVISVDDPSTLQAALVRLSAHAPAVDIDSAGATVQG